MSAVDIGGPKAASRRENRGRSSWFDVARMHPIEILVGVVASLLGVLQATAPGALTGVLGYNLGYDDGVYIGASINFTHGVMPYRDFVLVHPPGIVYLLAPFALIGHLTGTASVVAMTRVLAIVVVAANAMLAARVVRAADPVAAGVAGLGLALWPLSVSVGRGIELESFTVFFLLAGITLLWPATTRLRSGRRSLIGGVLLGFACIVKLWGVLPVAPAMILLVVRRRQRAVPAVAGVIVGGLVPCLPFLVTAPQRFWHDVVVSQLSREQYQGATSLTQRINLLFGFGGWKGISGSTTTAIVATVLVVAALAFVYVVRARERSDLEWYVLAATVVVAVGMTRASVLFDHYAYFPAVFFWLLVGVCVGALADEAADLVRGTALKAVTVTAAVLAALLVIAIVVADARYTRKYLAEVADPGARLRADIPSSACVVSDYSIEVLAAGRQQGSRSGCPHDIDPFGMYLALDKGKLPHVNPPFDASFVTRWQNEFASADFVLMRIPFSDFMPWPDEQQTWFASRFILYDHYHVTYDRPFIDTEFDIYIYQNVAPERSRAGG